MTASPDARLTCGFCEGTGVWADADGPPDPCPHCGGTGTAPSDAPAALGADASDRQAPDAFDGIRALVERLTPAERQRLYEALYVQYGCRIHR